MKVEELEQHGPSPHELLQLVRQIHEVCRDTFSEFLWMSFLAITIISRKFNHSPQVSSYVLRNINEHLLHKILDLKQFLHQFILHSKLSMDRYLPIFRIFYFQYYSCAVPVKNKPIPHLETTCSWEKNGCTLKLCLHTFTTLDRHLVKEKWVWIKTCCLRGQELLYFKTDASLTFCCFCCHPWFVFCFFFPCQIISEIFYRTL